MNNIEIVTANEILVVDSRLIAKELGIDHTNTFLRTIRKYSTDFEEFGVLVFETQKPLKESQDGRPETFCYLNEDQATYAMTLSRNSEQVRQCKRNLVKAFSEAKKLIQQNSLVAPTSQITLAPEIEAKLDTLHEENQTIIAMLKSFTDVVSTASEAIAVKTEEKLEAYHAKKSAEFQRMKERNEMARFVAKMNREDPHRENRLW